jgi:two-component system alkaline phosphatase synthesis response regulator PhoP
MNNTKTILIIDDEPLNNSSLKADLKEAGFRVLVMHKDRQDLELTIEHMFDLILLDITLTCRDGWELCRQIRQNSTVPLIILATQCDEVDRILGLEFGADDCLSKPFSFRELLARINAIFRRIALVETGKHDQIQIGHVRLDSAAYKVYKRDQTLVLRQKEYNLLYTLMSHAGQVVSRAELLDKVWGVDWLGDTRTLDVHIRWVREKIEENPELPRYIQTVRGVGYRFAAPEDLARTNGKSAH